MRPEEVRYESLGPEDRAKFDKSDAAEWQNILRMGAVTVLSPAERARVMKESPGRIIESRMVRRFKPIKLEDRVDQKAKSRWCVLCHQDPDTEIMGNVSYSPTPAHDTLMPFLVIAAGLSFVLQCADCTQAFCQSRPLCRSGGVLYARPCRGLGVSERCLIRLNVPVYGLIDAPVGWRRTLCEFFHQCGLAPNLMCPCFWTLRDAHGRTVGQVLIAVDDLLMAGKGPTWEAFLGKLRSKFEFGKWVTGATDLTADGSSRLPMAASRWTRCLASGHTSEASTSRGSGAAITRGSSRSTRSP
jgi:hypothetical protein